MDEPKDYHNKWSKPHREKWVSYDIAFMWILKKWYKRTYIQNRNRSIDIENKFMVTKGERGKGLIGILWLTYTHYYI